MTFFVYWEGRLVPETIAKELPFFEKFKTPSKCIAAKVPVQWKRRVCGQLFLDSSYHAIAKNKLRLFAQPDFNHWLNEAIPSFADQRLPFIKYVMSDFHLIHVMITRFIFASDRLSGGYKFVAGQMKNTGWSIPRVEISSVGSSFIRGWLSEI